LGLAKRVFHVSIDVRDHHLARVIIGAIAERMNFRDLLLFVMDVHRLFPQAHIVWALTDS